MPLPQRGRSKEEIFAELERFKARDLDWKAGRVWAYVYNPGDEVREVVNRAYTMFLTENALGPHRLPQPACGWRRRWCAWSPTCSGATTTSSATSPPAGPRATCWR